MILIGEDLPINARSFVKPNISTGFELGGCFRGEKTLFSMETRVIYKTWFLGHLTMFFFLLLVFLHVCEVTKFAYSIKPWILLHDWSCDSEYYLTELEIKKKNRLLATIKEEVVAKYKNAVAR